jgi:hypothetical protein
MSHTHNRFVRVNATAAYGTTTRQHFQERLMMLLNSRFIYLTSTNVLCIVVVPSFINQCSPAATSFSYFYFILLFLHQLIQDKRIR